MKVFEILSVTDGENPMLISKWRANAKQLIRMGYDGVMDDLMDEIVVFRPSQVRSMFARFDPNKVNSPNIRY